MKKLSIFFATLMMMNCNTQYVNSNHFIEFIHLGYTTHEYPILLISSQKIALKLNDSQLKELRQIDSISGGSGNLTERQKELYLKINYNRVVTDERTFSTVFNFVNRHIDYYVDSEYLKLHPIKESFEIVIDGKKEFFVNEKLKNQFVNALIINLKQEKNDENIIKEISYLRQDD